MKTNLAKFTAAFLLKHPVLEKTFCYFCSQPSLRKSFKLGSLAFGCIQVLKSPELRIAHLIGYKMYVNIAEPLGIAAYFFKENRTVWLTSELIRSGDMCIDAGANMGHYTFFMASKVGPKGKVIAFEPQPRYFQMISRSIQLNNYQNFVSVDSRALWNQSEEELKFYVSENPHNSGTSSLVNHGLYLSEQTTIKVKTVTLSDYCNAANIQSVRLLKIDVERTEIKVLQGMTNLLAKQFTDFIILETTAQSEAQKLLQDFDYQCFLLDSLNKNLISINKVDKDHFGDYLFVSKNCSFNFLETWANIIN